MEVVLGIALVVIFCVAFVESALLPLPLTLIMAPAVYAFSDAALGFIVVATAGSALGSLGGNYLGRWRGRDVLIRLVAEERFAWTERVYRNHGTFGLFLAAVSPLPYIPFTIASGIFGTTYRSVLLIAVTGRGVKYSVEVLALVWLTGLDLTRAFMYLGLGLALGYLVWTLALEDLVTRYLEASSAG